MRFAGPRPERQRRGAASRRLLGAIFVAMVAASCASGNEDVPVVDAFTAGSYWTAPLPDDAPLHPDSSTIIEFLAETNARDGCVTLAGTDESRWGTPVYYAGVDDPVYQVTSTRYEIPNEFGSLRIPAGAVPAANPDAEMVVYDLERGLVAHLSKAEYDDSADRWQVGGGSVAYLASNGLDSRTPDADDARNIGSFRGYNGVIALVTRAEVAAGQISHVLKVAVAESAPEAVWPMVGSDGDSPAPGAPPQGARLRIRPDVDLEEFDLSPEAAIIARALQEYGAIIADSSGGAVTLKLEDTATTGRAAWDLDTDALCAVPTSAYAVLEYGYDPTDG